MLKNLSFRAKLLSGFGVVLGLMVVIAVIVFFSIKSLQSDFRWVEHTHEVIAKATKIEAAAVDMETSMRGYLLAGQEDFLGPYNQGAKNFEILLAELVQTVSDNPAQVSLLREISSSIGQWKTKVTEPVIALRDEIGHSKTMNDMAELVQKAEGKVYLDKFRIQLKTLVDRERKLMDAQKLKVSKTNDFADYKQLTNSVIHTYQVIAAAESMLSAAVNMQTGLRGFLLSGQQHFLEPYNGGKKDFYQKITELSKKVSDNPQQVTLLSQIKRSIDDWINQVVVNQIKLRDEIGHSKTMDDMADIVGQAKGKIYFDQFRSQLKTFKDREHKLLTLRSNSLEKTEVDVINSTLFGTLIAVMLGLTISFWLITHVMSLLGGEPKYIQSLARTVAKGDLSQDLKISEADQGIYAAMVIMMNNLREKVIFAEKIAAGDLNHSIKLASEKDALGLALQNMTQNLNQVLNQTQAASIEITSGSGNLSSNSSAVSQGASDQADSLVSIGSSIIELTEKININADNASQAQILVSKAQAQAAQGSEKMQAMISSMAEITEASNSITGFIDIIDGIAQQTNLLALNAAIEAARAGEQGRGFAVVAEEVRNLAQRSTKTAEQTTKLVEGSVEKTSSGSSIASETADSLREIFDTVQQTAALIEEIADISNQQATGVNSINSGIAVIDTITQKNSEAAHESAAAAVQLSQQAENLQSMLANFELKPER
jgi:methyl-accepting chemotaxis protein